MTTATRTSRILSLVLAGALAVGLGACGGDDNSAVDEGVAPSSTTAPSGAPTSAGADDPLGQIIRSQIAGLNVTSWENNSDSFVFVMADDATADNVADACELIKQGQPGKEAITEQNGERTPCP